MKLSVFGEWLEFTVVGLPKVSLRMRLTKDGEGHKLVPLSGNFQTKRKWF
jgi:hypothetical protein